MDALPEWARGLKEAFFFLQKVFSEVGGKE
jgi:hypothetical protein